MLRQYVDTAFKIIANMGRDGFKLLLDVLARSQPAFNPTKAFPKPTWYSSQDMSLHLQNVGSCTSVSWASHRMWGTSVTQNRVLTSYDPSRSLHWLAKHRVSWSASSIKTQLVPVKNRGRAQLPTHLKITALADTLAQTIQPIDNELDFALTPTIPN